MSRGQSKQAVVLSAETVERIALEVLGAGGSTRKDPAVLAAESACRCAMRRAAQRFPDDSTKQESAVFAVASVLYGVELGDDDDAEKE